MRDRECVCASAFNIWSTWNDRWFECRILLAVWPVFWVSALHKFRDYPCTKLPFFDFSASGETRPGTPSITGMCLEVDKIFLWRPLSLNNLETVWWTGLCPCLRVQASVPRKFTGHPHQAISVSGGWHHWWMSRVSTPVGSLVRLPDCLMDDSPSHFSFSIFDSIFLYPVRRDFGCYRPLVRVDEIFLWRALPLRDSKMSVTVQPQSLSTGLTFGSLRVRWPSPFICFCAHFGYLRQDLVGKPPRHSVAMFRV